MQELNQKMFKLVKLIPGVIIKKVAVFPPFAGADLERYTTTLDQLQPACESYMDLLSADDVSAAPSDVFDLKGKIRNLQQAAFFGFLDVLDETRDFVVEKVNAAPAPEEEPPAAEPTPEPVAEEPAEEDEDEGSVTE